MRVIRTLNELMARIVAREERTEELKTKGAPDSVIQMEDQITGDMRKQYMNRSMWMFRCVGLYKQRVNDHGRGS